MEPMKPYRDYSDFLADHFPCKMQKLTVDAGNTCPNRDGTVGRGGCAYCNNASFSPLAHLRREPVSAQLEAGKRFFEKKYPHMRYLAYFQSYTSTHGDRDTLMAQYREALSVEKVDGLIIGTRPDCVDAPLLAMLRELSKPVFMEYGAESSHNATLDLVNRCHTWEQTVGGGAPHCRGGAPRRTSLHHGPPRRDNRHDAHHSATGSRSADSHREVPPTTDNKRHAHGAPLSGKCFRSRPTAYAVQRRAIS